MAHEPTTQEASFVGAFVRAVLVVHGDAPGVFPLREDHPVVVGRGDSADVKLDDASLSRAHAKILWQRGTLTVEDLGSKNGTWVRGERARGPSPVLPGESFRLGDVTASISIGAKIDDATARATWAYPRFVARVEDELIRARASDGALSLLSIRAIDGASIAAWLPAVRGRIKASDPIAAFSEHALLVLLPDTSASDAHLVAQAITDRAHAGTHLAAGMATTPPVSSVHELIGTAWEASHAATKQGRVTIASGAPRARSFVAETASMRELLALVRRLAPLPSPVLIVGETGTGKESIARALHENGPRAQGPLVAINGGAIPAGVLEDVLFGHEKGAFTGAAESSAGVLEQADGGTLFLDEVADLSARAQAALLRVFENKTVTRIGGVADIAVDVRVVSATHRDLGQLVDRGDFRADLYHRLSSMTLRVPALRERPADLERLIDVFLDEACERNGLARIAITDDARAALRQHTWPGNVRELKNAIERAVLLSAPMPIGIADVEEHAIAMRVRRDAPRAKGELKTLVREYEGQILTEALQRAGGNQTKAAKELGIPLRTFVHKLTQLGIRVPRKPR